MAIVTAVKSGVWSDPTVWDSGALPNPGDVVKPATFVVTVDMDVDVAELSQDTAGHTGRFEVSVAPRTIRALIRGGATRAVLKLVHNAGVVTVIGDVYAGSAEALWVNGAGGETHTFGLISSLGSGAGCRFDVVATMVHTGNIAGTAAGRGLFLGYGANLEVWGNLIGGSGSSLRYALSGLGATQAYNLRVHGASMGGAGAPGAVINALHPGLAVIDEVIGSPSIHGLSGNASAHSGVVVVGRVVWPSNGMTPCLGRVYLSPEAVSSNGVVLPVYGAGVVPMTVSRWRTSPPQVG